MLKKIEKSNEFLICAAERDYDEAQILLATRHANGYGFEKSYEKAFYWFQLLLKTVITRLEDVTCISLVMVARRILKSVILGRLGAEGGDANSQFVYASLLSQGNQSFDEQIVWLKEAASQGDENALATLKKILILPVQILE